MATSRKQTSRSRRAELEAKKLAQQQRDRKIRLLTFGAAGVVIVAIIIVLVVALNQAKEGGDIVPLHGDAAQTGITPNPDVAADVPTLDIYSDFQCPNCGTLETAVGDAVQSLIDDGSAKVVFHTRTFLDSSLESYNADAGNPKSSRRAAIAAACADTVEGDYYFPFFREIYNNQPATEGDGYSDTLLRDTIPATVGLTGDALTSFQTCYDDEATGKFVTAVDGWAQNTAKVNSTPTYKLNGTDITSDIFPNITDSTDEDAVATANAAAAAKLLELVGDATV